MTQERGESCQPGGSFFPGDNTMNVPGRGEAGGTTLESRSRWEAGHESHQLLHPPPDGFAP